MDAHQITIEEYLARPKERGGASEDAAAYVSPSIRAAHNQILTLLESCPLTADEICLALGGKITFWRPRCTELVILGRIVKMGERRKVAGQRCSSTVLALSNPFLSESTSSDAEQTIRKAA